MYPVNFARRIPWKWAMAKMASNDSWTARIWLVAPRSCFQRIKQLLKKS